MKSFAFAALIASAAAVPAWSDWSDPSKSTTTTTKPVEITSTTTTSHWEDWTTTSKDPSKETTTTTTTTHWEDWTTTEDPSKKTTTTTTPSKETTTTAEHTWSDWVDPSSDITYTTTVVTAIETYCPKPTDFTHAGKTYHVTEATTITITDCPCTISVPIYVKSTSSCSETPAKETASTTYSVPSSEGTGVYSKPVSPYETTSAPVAEYTGAANRVANVGAGLVGVAAAAVLLL